MPRCEHPDHDGGAVDDTVSRRFKRTELVAEFCPDHDPLTDPDLGDHFESVEA